MHMARRQDDEPLIIHMAPWQDDEPLIIHMARWQDARRISGVHGVGVAGGERGKSLATGPAPAWSTSMECSVVARILCSRYGVRERPMCIRDSDRI